MFKKIILILVITLLSCSDYKSDKKETVIINDHGGYMFIRYNEISRMIRPIRVKGYCASACTYVFMFDNTCVYENATIVFHAPTENGEIDKYYLEDLRDSFYSKELRDWFGTITDRTEYSFTGWEMNQKFKIKLCE